MKKEINIFSIVAIIMCIVLVLTCVIKHVGTKNPSNKDESVSTGIDDVSIEGDSSFGQLFALALGEKVQTINENNNYVIYSVEIVGNTANVKYSAQQDCTLVVNICDETGENVLGNGNTRVYADEGFASVKISSDNMPDFFLIKASLVESDKNTLLSTEYLSPMYSREMQDLMEMTIYDFDEDRVINLDDSVENNFAVYKKDVVVFSAGDNENILVSCDYGNYEYIIRNPDETVKNLKQGDTFSYRYYDDEYIIDTVESIKEDGDNIVICGAKTSMEEVFDYVKIDTTSDMSAAEYNAETKDEGVGEAQWMAYPENGVYPGEIGDTPVKNTLSYNSSTPELMNMPAANKAGENKEGNDKDSVFFPLAKEWKDDVSEIKISGGVFLKADVAAKMFVVPVYGLSDVYRYIELEIDMSASVGTKIKAKMGADKPIGLKLGELTFVPIAGVNVSFTPSIILEAEATIELMAELKGKTGFRYTTCLGNDTLESLHEEWKFVPHIEIKGTIFLGFSMEPAVSFVHKNVAKFGLEAKTGVEVSASLEGEITDEYIHECLACIEGDIHVVLEGSVSAQLFKSKFLNLKVEFDGLKWKWGDFYYSATFEKAGFTKCPYKKYKVTVMAVENGGQQDETPLENVVIKNLNNTNGLTENQEEYITDKKGQAILYLSAGEHELMATKSGYKSQTKKVVVGEEPTGTFFDMEEGEDEDEIINNSIRKQRYEELLQYIYENGDTSDQVEYWENNPSDYPEDFINTSNPKPGELYCRYDIFDIDNDHKDELIMKRCDLSHWYDHMYGSGHVNVEIYEYDVDKKEMICQLDTVGYDYDASHYDYGYLYFSNHIKFYDNGRAVISQPYIMVNGGDLYQYVYNVDTGKYDIEIKLEFMDVDMVEVFWHNMIEEGISPVEVDKDEDGIIYVETNEDGGYSYYDMDDITALAGVADNAYEIIPDWKIWGEDNSQNSEEKHKEYVGEWEIDDEHTMAVNGASMWDLFGTSYSDYGCGMSINEDNSFSYWIAAGQGGEGTWEITKNGIRYDIEPYELSEESGELERCIDENEEVYLIMKYEKYVIMWRKK